MVSNSLGDEFIALFEVVKKLASESGCPWDSKQTIGTLKSNFQEECQELLEAIDNNDNDGIIDELGDLLYLIYLSAAAGAKENTFNMYQVVRNARKKAIYRHPKQFGSKKQSAESSDPLLEDGSSSKQFQKQKRKEKVRFVWKKNLFPR